MVQEMPLLHWLPETGQLIEWAMEIAALVNQNAPLGIQASKFGARKYLEQAQQTVIDVLPDIRGRMFGTEDANEGIKSSI